MRGMIALSTFAKRIKGYRKAAGLTQLALAKLVGVTKALISQIEKGTTKEVKMILLFKLSDKLGVAARFLATGEGSPLRVGPISAEAISLLIAFRACSPEAQKEMIKSAEFLARVQSQAPHPQKPLTIKSGD